MYVTNKTHLSLITIENRGREISGRERTLKYIQKINRDLKRTMQKVNTIKLCLKKSSHIVKKNHSHLNEYSLNIRHI